MSDETLSQRVSLLRKALGDGPAQPRYIASVRRWGYKVVAAVERVAEVEEPIRALAVLPLASLGGDGEHEYLADALTDALITSLSKLGALKVISRTSVMRYRHAEKPLPAVARELAVGALVEGSVLRSGSRVWITVQLVDGATDGHIWSESYERDVGDVPALLDEVAGTIADAIRIAVSPDERTRLMGRRPVDAAAYEAFLRAVHCIGKYTPPDTERAISHLEAALSRDPTFALAHAALAGACVMRAIPFGVGMPAAEQHGVMARAKAAAERAVQLDETLATGYAVLGAVLYMHDLDWRRAREVLDRSIRLDPSCSTAHVQRAMVAACAMEREVARRATQRAIELDPLNLGLRSQCAEIRYWVRDYDAAIQGALEILSFDPSFPRAHFVLGRVYEALDRIPEAIERYREAGLLTATLARAARTAFEEGGAPGFHRWALGAGLGGHGGPVPGTKAPLRPLWRAKLHCQAGDVDEAIACLEQAYAERDGLLMLLNVDTWDPIRGDPRFQALLRRLDLPDVQVARAAPAP